MYTAKFSTENFLNLRNRSMYFLFQYNTPASKMFLQIITK